MLKLVAAPASGTQREFKDIKSSLAEKEMQTERGRDVNVAYR